MYQCVLSKGSRGSQNVVCLIIDIEAQNTESAETWHLTKAEAGRKANKGENKGRIWAMIMQLSADPTHEYGSCDGISRCVWCMHMLYLTAFVCLCAHTTWPTNYACTHMSASLADMCMYYYIKPTGVKAFVCLYLPVLAPTGAKKSIN